MDFKMNRNGSGVYDETAYKALMGAPKSGEVWTCMNGSKEKEVLIIKNHGTICNVLTLLDECKSSHCIEITSRSIKYTDPRMIQYFFNDNIGRFVKALSDEEFDKVLDEIEDALELNIYQAEESQEIGKLKEEVDNYKNEIKELQAKLSETKNIPVPSDSFYKRLYDELIDKLIDKKVM